MLWFLVILAVLGGALLPVQAVLNARLGAGLSNPLLAALVSFVVGSLVLALLALLTRAHWPAAGRLAAVPPLAWLGGLLGAVYVPAALLLAPRLGTTVLFGAVIVGQLLISLVLDHFGLLGLAVHKASWPRLLGVLLVLGGVWLFRRF